MLTSIFEAFLGSILKKLGLRGMLGWAFRSDEEREWDERPQEPLPPLPSAYQRQQPDQQDGQSSSQQ